MSRSELSASDRTRIFRASCVAMVATAMCFGVRAEIMDALGSQFHLTNERIGWIAGAAFWGFTVAMFVGGQLCDVVGMRRLLAAAWVGHIGGVLLTIFATGFGLLYCGTLAIGLANGLVESALNPLIPTLYPERKTERLNALHVWFPGGIVMGGLVALACTQLGWNWQVKMALILVPVLLYGLLFFQLELPPTERVQHNVSAGAMYREALRPGFLVLLGCILLTAATELGPSQWIPSILSHTASLPGILVLVWISGLMAVGRFFAGHLVAHISPVTLVLGCLLLSALGLLGLGIATTPLGVFSAATIFAVGVCYCWPTMYGITSERFPAGGAFLLALIGSAGMLSDAFVVPMMGRMYDVWGPGRALRSMAVFPLVAALVFALIWLRDRTHGGYRRTQLALVAPAQPHV
jgi:predicted MFS family arabinose efflux permease